MSATSPAVANDYFRTDPWVEEFAGTYADPDAHTEHNMWVSWNHPLQSVFTAVLSAGFHLRFFHEYDYTLFQLNDWLVQGDGQRWCWPSEDARLPLMFSIKAYKPG